MSFEGFKDLLPEITALNEAYWQGLNEGEVRLQTCKACGARQHPPESFCYACGSTDIAWEPSTGAGEIYSFIEVHQLYNSAFKDHLPYVVAIVQMDDGPRILGAMLGLEAEPEIGARVKPAIKQIDNECAFLTFKLA